MSGDKELKPPVFVQWGDGPIMQAPEPPPPPPPAPKPREVVGESLALIQQPGHEPLLITPEATAASYAFKVNEGMGIRESAFRLWWEDNPDLETHIAVMGGISHRIPEIFGVPLPVLPPPELRAAVEQQLVGPLYRQHFIVLVEAALRGFIEVTGVYPRLSMEPMRLDTDTICEGRLDLARETLTDYRSGHAERYWSLHVKATTKGLKVYNSAVVDKTRAQIFTDTVLAGDHYMEGKTIHILRTKQSIYKDLSRAHPGIFEKWSSFESKYARKGKWALDLHNPIYWAQDSNNKEGRK